MTETTQMGWRCPGCGRCFSPALTECYHCQPKVTFTFSNDGWCTCQRLPGVGIQPTTAPCPLHGATL